EEVVRNQTVAAARAALSEANVSVSLLDESGGEHPVSKFLSENSEAANETATAVVVSPGGQMASLPLEGISSDALDRDAFFASCRTLVESPVRGKIIPKLLTTYCTLLVVEGDDAAVNQRMAEATKAAVVQMNQSMELVDKPVQNGPFMTTIKRSQQEQERWLLWGVQLDEAARRDGAVAVVFGRGRRIGDVLAGPSVTQKSIFNILAVVGRSCECDLDRGWLYGQMMPHVWDIELRKAALRDLGFDADSPMVKSEISRILSHGAGAALPGDRVGGGDSGMDILLGYSEIEIGPAEVSGSPPSTTNATTEAGSKVTATAQQASLGTAAPSSGQAQTPTPAQVTAQSDGSITDTSGGVSPMLIAIMGIIFVAVAGTLGIWWVRGTKDV
ncbi:MAG: hypothetical protein MI741_08600, partial [Rhodospirillales bacterium]|nr:hypothetical protein [Rhodospirillales bacterium]